MSTPERSLSERLRECEAINRGFIGGKLAGEAADTIDALQQRAEKAEAHLRDISVALSDAGCLALTVQGAVAEVINQRDEANEAADDHDGVMGRLRALLNRAAVALKGPEPPMTMHDWSDIPDRIDALQQDVRRLEAELKAAKESDDCTAAMCSALAGDVERLTAERNEASSEALENLGRLAWAEDYAKGHDAQVREAEERAFMAGRRSMHEHDTVDEAWAAYLAQRPSAAGARTDTSEP